MMRRPAGMAAAAALLLLSAACPPPVKQKPQTGTVPTTPATVLTIHTNIEPEKKAFVSVVVRAGDQVRIGDELDHWRLINLKDDSVTFVDDVSRTFHTVSGAVLREQRQKIIDTPLPPGITRATIQKTGTERVIGKWPARLYLIQLGAYRRELWLSDEPDPGKRSLPLFTASEPIGNGYPGVMRDVQMELIRSTGFPVADHSEMPLGKQRLVIDRRLLKVEQRPVPLSWVTIPKGYRDLTTPLKGSAAGHPRASSPLPGRKAPAKG